MKELIINGKQKFMDIDVPVIEYSFDGTNSQKVIVAKSISDIHNIKMKLVNDYIGRLIRREVMVENVDYIDLKSKVANDDQYTPMWFENNLGITQQAYYRSVCIYLLSLRGYMKFINYINDTKAVDIMYNFINDYFNKSTQVQDINNTETQDVITESNEMKLFENPEFGSIRTIMINNEPWFVGKDVASILGYSNPRDAISKHVDTNDKGVSDLDTPGGVQKMAIINESGLYSLVFSSAMPNAKKFSR